MLSSRRDGASKRERQEQDTYAGHLPQRALKIYENIRKNIPQVRGWPRNALKAQRKGGMFENQCTENLGKHGVLSMSALKAQLVKVNAL